MKTYRLINLFCVVFLLTLGLTACSDDDEGASGTGIVSTWRYDQGTDGEYYELLRFYLDGTFLSEEHEYYNSTNEWRTRTYRGTYEYNEESQELTMSYVDDNGNVEQVSTFDILLLDSNTLVIDAWWGSSYDYPFTFYRQ